MNKKITLSTSLIIGVSFLSLFLSTYCLRYNPSSWFDEGIYIQIANNLSRSGQLIIQVAPNRFEPTAFMTVGYPIYYVAVISYKIFGASFIAARFAAVFYLLLFIFVYFLLNKKLYSQRTAILSTLLLITFAPLYGNGRNLLGDIPGLFLMTLGLIGFLYWEKSEFKHTLSALFAGLGFGLAVAAKPNFLVLGGGILISLILNIKAVKRQIKQWLLFIIGGLGPIFWWIYAQSVSLDMTRGLFKYYTNPYAKEDISLLIIPNLIRFFTESTPLYFTFLSIILILAVFFKLKQKQKLTGPEIIIYFFIIFTFISYLRTPGWYRYFFLAHIWLLFLFIDSLNIIIRKIFRFIKKPEYIIITLSIGLILIQSIHLIKTDLECSETKVDRASNFLNQWTKEEKILFINVPELVARTPNLNYYQYLESNRGIIFGQKELEGIKSNLYEKIILKNSEEKTITEKLECYELEEQVNIYQFYKKKDICL